MAECVKIHDKNFRLWISEAKLQERIVELGKIINAQYGDKNPILLAVLNGSFIFSADLIRHLNFDPEIHFVRIASYGEAMISSGKFQQLMGLSVSVQEREVIVIEDIVDTGNTLNWLRSYLMEKGAASVSTVSLLFKPKAFQQTDPPEIVGFEIPNEFVVGYGMDYAQRGRSLRAIYQLAE